MFLRLSRIKERATIGCAFARIVDISQALLCRRAYVLAFIFFVILIFIFGPGLGCSFYFGSLGVLHVFYFVPELFLPVAVGRTKRHYQR